MTVPPPTTNASTPDPRSSLAEAWAHGRLAGRRSHRLHRPRGGSCGRGYCQQCPLTGSGLACETSTGTIPGRWSFDALRPLGALGERMEPWFYERRFLRPRAARQLSLAALRRMSAAPKLPGEPALVRTSAAQVTCEVLVVGGGPTGVAAATALCEDTDVLVITRAAAGGSLPRPDRIAAEIASDLAVLRRRVSVRERTMCLGAYEEEGIVAALGPDGPLAIRAERIVVATGAYDRPLVVPGADLPGVIGVRGFETLARQGAFGPHVRIGAFGGSAELERADETARAHGLTLAWAVCPREPPASIADTEPGRRLVALEGRRRVRAAVLDGGERRPADIVVIGFSQPTYELQIQLGQVAAVSGSPPVVVTAGPTWLPMLSVGEAAGPVDPEEALGLARSSARAWLAGGEPPTPPPVAELPPATTGPHPDGVVCLCEDVRVRDVDACIDDGFGDVELFKRRSGAGTGACQGKLCLGPIAEVLSARGLPPGLPGNRPPIRPVPVASLGGAAGGGP